VTATDFDFDLTPWERRNLAAAYECIAACVAGWTNTTEGRSRLDAVLADDFVQFTPTSDPARRVRPDKHEYIDRVTNVERLEYQPGSRMQITGHTVHGDRVATETSTDIIRLDGSPYRNRLHQFFLFNAASRIVEYRTYMDSATIVDDATAATSARARAFFSALETGSAPELNACVAATFRFHGADGAAMLNATELLNLCRRIKSRHPGFADANVVAEPDVASVEAGSSVFIVRLEKGRVVLVEEFASGPALAELDNQS
jgi:ketosteroid isomerase-like protein